MHFQIYVIDSADQKRFEETGVVSSVDIFNLSDSNLCTEFNFYSLITMNYNLMTEKCRCH